MPKTEDVDESEHRGEGFVIAIAFGVVRSLEISRRDAIRRSAAIGDPM